MQTSGCWLGRSLLLGAFGAGLFGRFNLHFGWLKLATQAI
jgi:hypothetical protein